MRSGGKPQLNCILVKSGYLPGSSKSLITVESASEESQNNVKALSQKVSSRFSISSFLKLIQLTA